MANECIIHNKNFLHICTRSVTRMMKFRSAAAISIDPRIQFYCRRHQETGGELTRFVSADAGEIPVIAQVNDLQRWKSQSEVLCGVEVPTADQKWLVTGRIPITRLEYVRQLVFVDSLKATQPITPMLDATLEDFGLTTTTLGRVDPDLFAQAGEGTVVGVVDFGGDFAHRNFLNADGSTRLALIWDQAGRATRTSPHGYGRVFTQEQINRALRQRGTNPYNELGYDPGRSDQDGTGTHGTHVMDIAAGSGVMSGVAPKAELVFVDLSTIQRTAITDVLATDFGDSVRVIEAVDFIFKHAGDKPCVVNLSLGTNGGPHDGTNLVEKMLDELVRAQPNRAVVIAAANAYDDKIHQTGQVQQGESAELYWTIPYNDRTPNEVEIWYPQGDEFELELIDHLGNSITRVPLGESGQVTTENASGVEETVAHIIHRKKDPGNHDNVIHIFHEPKHYRGRQWTLKLHGVNITDGNYHAWVERDHPRYKSEFVQQTPSHTLGSLSTGHYSIVVGSYDAHKPTKPISYFSSAGPTRDGRQKPDISAPGGNVWAAKSTSGDGETRKSGTSMAAPAVAGLVARMFSWAQLLGRNLSIEETLQILQESAHPASQSSAWDNRYGFGRISATSVFQHRLFTESPQDPAAHSEGEGASADVTTPTVSS
jgi:subtilisin family serine protease